MSQIHFQVQPRQIQWNSGPLIGPYSGALSVPPDVLELIVRIMEWVGYIVANYFFVSL